MSTLICKSCLRHARTQIPTLQSTRKFQQTTLLARLLSSLAILEQRDGKLNPSSLSAVTAAQRLGGSITGFVAGKNTKSVAQEAAKVKGIEKIVVVEDEAYDKVRRTDRSVRVSSAPLISSIRVFQRTTLHYSRKTSSPEVTPMLLPDTLLL